MQLMNARARIGHWLRRWADRIDVEGAPRSMGHSFTFETGKGIRFREDGRGCKLWYLGFAEFEKAHTEADSAEADARQARRHELIEISMTDPDPEKARAAAVELHKLILQGNAVRQR